MSKIIEFKKKQNQLFAIKTWVGKFGERHGGVGDGYGYVSPSLEIRNLKICHQACSNGEVIYYEAPGMSYKFLEKAFIDQFPKILSIALELQKEDLRISAIEALEECKEIMEEIMEEPNRESKEFKNE